MKVVREHNLLDMHFPGCALTIGNFDGVHRGHQHILARAGQLARPCVASVVVFTFDPHPARVLYPAKAPPTLMPVPLKLEVLTQLGVDVVVLAESTPELLALTAEQFVDRVIGRIQPAYIIEGASFGFGRDRTGTPQTLAQLADQYDYQLTVVEPIKLDIPPQGMVEVSSSVIRRMVKKGQVEQAALCLGRPYTILGSVIHGAQRGAGLGYPTANLQTADQLIPADGVYAGWVRFENDTPTGPNRQLAALSIGTAPTFTEQGVGGEPPARLIEAHVLDFEGDLYSHQLRFEFVRWLRNQEKFSTAKALTNQMAQDIEAVRQLSAEPQP